MTPMIQDLIEQTTIGTYRDNLKCPIHNWYKFTAGYSYKFVDAVLCSDKMVNCVFDPFSGCGTTLVEAQKLGIRSIGNESQELMCNVINAKLNWDINEEPVSARLEEIKSYVQEHQNEDISASYNQLLTTLYDTNSLKTLYLLRNCIRTIEDDNLKGFFNLALGATLHKASMYPIAMPYIVRTKPVNNRIPAMDAFLATVSAMLNDLKTVEGNARISVVYNVDSRQKNDEIPDGSCDVCITSPPYLNNLDYGELSKVLTHFFEITKDWHDITENVRHKLVTGATTHYRDNDFKMEEFLHTEFAMENEELCQALQEKFTQIKANSKRRKGRKSFHIMMMHYFNDMYMVLKEMYRVLCNGSEAYLILGDSAPYGVYVPTTQFLGEIALSVGFAEYNIYKIRSRGDKWKSLSNRHDVPLSENLLVLHKTQ